MGLLEYQAMPSLRQAAHDNALCTFNNRSAPDRDKWLSLSGQEARTTCTKSHPAGALSSAVSKAGLCVGPALGLIGQTTTATEPEAEFMNVQFP